MARKTDIKKDARPGQVEVGEQQPVRLSKTQKKKAALSLQDLGERLVKLPDELLKRIDLPGDVLAAVIMAKTIKQHAPRNRQMQYIGTLMRKYDPAPVREFLEGTELGAPRSKTRKLAD